MSSTDAPERAGARGGVRDAPPGAAAALYRKELTEIFGFQAMRPGQSNIIADVMAGQSVVAVMPTGAGKSLCYQLPAVVLAQEGGFCLVVSPLIALMKDQVDSLRARGIPAAALTSAVSSAEQAEILAGIRAGLYSLIYVAPERFRSARFLEALEEVGGRLGLMAIDEAHCISQWGHDFRPDYRRIGEAMQRLQPARRIALTATATPEVRQDIAAQLHFEEPRFHIKGFDRPNLRYAVVNTGGPSDKCERLIELVRMRTGVALVYAATRKNAERYQKALCDAGMRGRVYHAGLGEQERSDTQDAFMAGALDVIVATNAFGMGVDKDNIRLLIHADLPRSAEAYYQEAGRAGRDGQLADCLLMFNHGDVRLQEFLIDATSPSAEVLRGTWRVLRDQPELGRGTPEHLAQSMGGEVHASSVSSAMRILERHGYLRNAGDGVEAVKPGEIPGEFPVMDVEALDQRAVVERSKLRTMVEYAYYPRCRRQFVLSYFGDADWLDRDKRCSGCDNCNNEHSPAELTDTEAFQVRALLALVQRLDGRFGRNRLAGIANGTDDDPRYSEVPEAGVLRGESIRYLVDLLRNLDGAGLLGTSRGDYPTICLAANGRAVLANSLRLESVTISIPATRPGRRKKNASSQKQDESAPIDPGVAERLKALRRALADEQSTPAYVVFSNRTLEAIASAKPTDRAGLLQINGMGPSRLDKYGDAILAAVQGE